MAAVNVSAEDAISNLGSWAKFIGFNKIPEWLLSPTIDTYVFTVSLAITIISLIILWVFYRKDSPNIWLYDAAQYIVTRDWNAEQIVGYGKEIMRLRNEGTTLWGSETNCQTGEQRHVRHTPEEEALAIRNTRTENVNNALEEIRQKAVNGFPVWSKQDHEKSSKLIDKEYWECYGFEKIEDLKKSSLDKESLKTENKIPLHNKPIYHSLETSKAKIEELWPPENT